jgi:hypothetical protein
LYPTSNRDVINSISFLSIDPNDNQCVRWLKTNNYKHKACISFITTGGDYLGDDGPRNYAVYTDSQLQPVVDAFNFFIDKNKKPMIKWKYTPS